MGFYRTLSSKRPLGVMASRKRPPRWGDFPMASQKSLVEVDSFVVGPSLFTFILIYFICLFFYIPESLVGGKKRDFQLTHVRENIYKSEMKMQ